jgi:hypothetical protein
VQNFREQIRHTKSTSTIIKSLKSRSVSIHIDRRVLGCHCLISKCKLDVYRHRQRLGCRPAHPTRASCLTHCQHKPTVTMRRQKYPSFDLFSNPPPPNLTHFQQQYVRDFDWASSLLGPVEGWSLQLRQMVNIIQRDSSGSCIYWDIPGKNGSLDVVIVYNEAYTHLMCVIPSLCLKDLI